MASTYEMATATERVTPNCRKNLPTTPLMKATGMKMAMTASVAASAAKVISLVPSLAAFTLSLPISAWRKMFSMTMTASSTTRPTASDRPSRVNVLSVKPQKYRTAMVPSSDIGIAKSTFMVADSDPRKTQHTKAVRMTARPSSIAISLTDSLMKTVVSKRTSSFIPGGSVFWRSAMALRTALATATALEPGCFRTPSACTFSPFDRA